MRREWMGSRIQAGYRKPKESECTAMSRRAEDYRMPRPTVSVRRAVCEAVVTVSVGWALGGWPWGLGGAAFCLLLAAGRHSERRRLQAIYLGAAEGLDQCVSEGEVLALRCEGATRAYLLEPTEDEGIGWVLVSDGECLLIHGQEFTIAEDEREESHLRRSGRGVQGVMEFLGTGRPLESVEIILNPKTLGVLATRWSGRLLDDVVLVPRKQLRTDFPSGLPRCAAWKSEARDPLSCLNRLAREGEEADSATVFILD